MDMEMETGGGLMPQIQQIIAPPPSEAPLKVKRKERDVERRRGKGQNRDTCDACGDCGSLICCEKCPTALHLLCQDPPLDEDDVPLGEWLCRNCKAKAKPKDKKCLEDSNETLTPFQLLMKAAVEQNPAQYDLPEKLKLPIPFPGADKGPKKVLARRGSAMKKNTPEPLRLCFECHRGVRVAPLLHCDYCSSSYHLDCLNPPLTAPPSGTTWMCPNHPEHVLDQKLLGSTSGVERAKLWEKAAKDLDQHAVKLEFLRKASRKNPPFRFRVTLPERQKVQVPAAIVSMYKKPLPLVPPLPNHVKYEKSWKSGDTPTQSETEQWLSSLFQLQLSLAWDITKGGSTQSEPSRPEEPVNEIPANPEAVEEMMEQMFSTEPKRNQKFNRAAIEKFCSLLESESPFDAELSKLDPKLIRVLACQRLLQLVPHFKNGNDGIFDRPPLEPKVKIKEESPSNDVYAVFDENLYLKNGVVCSKKKYVALKDVSGDLKVEEWNDMRRPARHNVSSDSLEEVKEKRPPPRAALAPIGSVLRVRPVAMRRRTLSIGTSPDNDVCLSEFGSCHFTSPKHAVIFCDAMTGVYELLNYSPHGTIVDGVQYCIDATQCRVQTVPSVADPLVQGVRAMLDKRRGLKRVNGASEIPRLTPDPPKRLCRCRERLSDPTGWEGSAIVQHCSHLVFGCLQFVFSISDFAPGKILTPDVVERKKCKVEAEESLVESEAPAMASAIEENGLLRNDVNEKKE